jgi:hypothetical protein
MSKSAMIRKARRENLIGRQGDIGFDPFKSSADSADNTD